MRRLLERAVEFERAARRFYEEQAVRVPNYVGIYGPT